jgi:hypothetical protein
MLHKLKRTIAVACLTATACFVILWMRSYAAKDVIWVGGDSPQISRISTPPGVSYFQLAATLTKVNGRGIARLPPINVM